jgi:hypothetical protein
MNNLNRIAYLFPAVKRSAQTVSVVCVVLSARKEFLGVFSVENGSETYVRNMLVRFLEEVGLDRTIIGVEVKPPEAWSDRPLGALGAFSSFLGEQTYDRFVPGGDSTYDVLIRYLESQGTMPSSFGFEAELRKLSVRKGIMTDDNDTDEYGFIPVVLLRNAVAYLDLKMTLMGVKHIPGLVYFEDWPKSGYVVGKNKVAALDGSA